MGDESWRAVVMFPTVGNDEEATKSSDGSSYRLSSSGTSLQNTPKVSEKAQKISNRSKNRIGFELRLLARTIFDPGPS